MAFRKKLSKKVESPDQKEGVLKSKNKAGIDEDSPPRESVKRSAIFRKLKEIGYKTGEIKVVFGKRKNASANDREKKQEK